MSLALFGVLALGLPALVLGGPLIDAASRGDLEAVRAQIAAGTRLENRDERGWTPLMFAAALGHVTVVRVLLEAGADPNPQATDGTTPLIAASVGGHLEIIDLLIAGGADPAVPNRAGATARIKAKEYGYPEIVARLDRAQATSEAPVPATAPAPAAAAPDDPASDPASGSGADPDDLAVPPIDPPPPSSVEDVVVEAFDAVYMLVQDATFRKLPSVGAPAAGQLPAGFAIKVTGKVRGANWYRVGPPAIAVWVPGQAVRPSTEAEPE